MKRLLVNDVLTCIPGTRTFWHDLEEWFGMDFVGANYDGLPGIVEYHLREKCPDGASLIIRNASYFGPLKSSQSWGGDSCPDCDGPMRRCGKHGDAGEPPMEYHSGIPTISLLQDIMEKDPQRKMQEEVINSSYAVVFNSEFTASKYLPETSKHPFSPPFTIPLPVDFDLFQPGNPMGLQQELSLPDNCVLWVGASEGAAGQVKGVDILLNIARMNPDLHFVAVFKDKWLDYCPPNMRMFTRQSHAELVKIIGACRVGLCTSRTESQHLAGIEMGACGVPIVAPPVGIYWKREDLMPGSIVKDATPAFYATMIRAMLTNPGDPQAIRSYWQKEFSKPVIRAKWEELIREVECSGQS